MRRGFYGQFVEKHTYIKFHENLFSGSRVVPCWQTEGETGRVTKLIVTSFHFAKSD